MWCQYKFPSPCDSELGLWLQELDLCSPALAFRGTPPSLLFNCRLSPMTVFSSSTLGAWQSTGCSNRMLWDPVLNSHFLQWCCCQLCFLTVASSTCYSPTADHGRLFWEQHPVLSPISDCRWFSCRGSPVPHEQKVFSFSLFPNWRLASYCWWCCVLSPWCDLLFLCHSNLFSSPLSLPSWFPDNSHSFWFLSQLLLSRL